MTPPKHKNAHSPEVSGNGVFIVDDHPIIRYGLSQLIEQEASLRLAGESADPRKAIEQMEATQPAVAIIDISMKGMNGIELIRQLRDRLPHLRILVFSIHDERIYAERVLAAGAKGYVMKGAGMANLLEAIHRILEGGIFISPELERKLLEKLVGGRNQVSGSPIEALSNRELEIYQLIGEGLSTRQIAKQLHVSVKTVETHRAHIMSKLGLEHSAQLVQHAIHWIQTEGTE